MKSRSRSHCGRPRAVRRIRDVCRKMGVSEETFQWWKKKFTGMGVAEVRRQKSLEDKNRKLKQRVADLSLDKHILQDAHK